MQKMMQYRTAVRASKGASGDETLKDVERKMEWLEATMARISGDTKRIAASKGESNFTFHGLAVANVPFSGGLSKITRDMVSDLPTQRDVDALLAQYGNMLEESAADIDPQVPDIPQDTDIDLGECFDDLGDLGVDKESKMSTEALMKELGIFHLAKQTFPAFNPLRHTEGKSAWDSPKDFIEGAPGIEDLRLRWHQLAGIHALISRGLEGQGVLLADDVGIGKTAQIMGQIAFVMMTVLTQQNKKASIPVAPIIGEYSHISDSIQSEHMRASPR